VFVCILTSFLCRYILNCGLSVPFFPYYLTNDTIFEKEMLLNIKCVLTFFTTFV